jgi:hypothetical protein
MCSSGKAKYSDEAEALWAIEVQNGSRRERGLASVRLYLYTCQECGSLHLTKQKQKPPSEKNPPRPPSDAQLFFEEMKTGKEEIQMNRGGLSKKLEIGDKVYHRNLRLNGVVVAPPFLGVDEGFTELVEFEDGETREVSVHLLEKR